MAVPPRLSIAIALLSDHHVRRLYHGKRVATNFEGEIVDRLIRNRRSDDQHAADVDPDMCCRLACRDRDNLALELITSA